MFHQRLAAKQEVRRMRIERARAKRDVSELSDHSFPDSSVDETGRIPQGSIDYIVHQDNQQYPSSQGTEKPIQAID